MCETRISSRMKIITILFVICCCCLPAHAGYVEGTGESNDPMLSIAEDSNGSELLGYMYFHYEYLLIVSFCGWPPQEESLAGSPSGYGDDCPPLQVSWRVNEQPIMFNDGYPNEELTAFLISGKDGNISFSCDWPYRWWDYILNCGAGCSYIYDLYGNSGRKNQMLHTIDTYGFDFAGHEITDLQVYNFDNSYSQRVCWGWNCMWYDYYKYDIYLAIYGEFTPFFDGAGTKEDPYQIWNAEQMNEIGRYAAYWDKCFKLMADIDLSGFTGTNFNIIGNEDYPFTGVFDGNGHTISKFTYTSTGTNCIGVFGYVRGDNAEIKDLNLLDPNVYAGTGDIVGSLVGSLYSGTVLGCYVNGGSVEGRYDVGGLVGRNNGTIYNCYATGSVFGDQYVGGLVGYNENSIVDCYTSGNVTGGDLFSYVGGLCGKSTGPHHGTGQSRIQNCFSKATVKGNETVGGLIGHSGAIVTGCYSNGTVIGRDGYCWDIGGLIGHIGGHGSTINCYSTGSVFGERASGLVGYNEGAVVGSYWDIETSGKTISDAGIGLTTVEMQMASTFLCWGYEPVWTIDEGVDYPRLVWENKPGELITVPSDLYGGGTGEPEDPYLIYTAEQLNTIGLYSCHWNKHFLLCEDIDLREFTGTSFNIIGFDYHNPFSGVFDGNGRKIFNFIYTSTDKNYIGLFGWVSGVIKDLGMIDPNVDAGTVNYVSSLVGRLYYGTITNCYVEGGSVEGDWHVGGLAGRNDHGTISKCYSTSTVSGVRRISGLVGYNNEGKITNCYSSGTVSGDKKVGGLVGRNRLGTIANCYAAGSVIGNTYVGGLLGEDFQGKGKVTDSFWDIETSGQTTSVGGTGLPTEEMKMQTTFTDAGWDFVGETFNGIEDIWFIPQQDYPHLWWEGMQVSMKLTPRTLNCRSEGNWVKAHLTLPQGFTVADVDSNRPAVLHSFGFESAPLYVFVNKDKVVEIEAAFERDAVCSLAGNWPQELTVAGFLADGNIFLGISTVRIIHPGMKVIEELASYWLNADCVQPDFCDRIDMNRDSLVNLADYALLMNIEVDFVSDNDNY